MQLVYTTGWTGKDIKYGNSYQEWLQSLRDGDHVLLQSFCPAKNGALDLGIEMWKFERYEVRGGKIGNFWNSYPFNIAEGERLHLHSNEAWGEVFPDRIIPCHNDLPTSDIGDWIFGHKPVYEPFYFGATRLVFLLPRNREQGRVDRVKKVFPHFYIIECNQGLLYHCFTHDEDRKDALLEELGAEKLLFLYSQHCKE